MPSQCDRWPPQPRVPVHVTSILHPIVNLNERLYRSGTELVQVQAGGSHDCLKLSVFLSHGTTLLRLKVLF